MIVSSCSSPLSFKRPEYTSRSICSARSYLPSLAYVIARLAWTARTYASTFQGVGNGTGTTSDLRVRKCGVQEEVDGPFRPTLYISPALDAAEAHHMPPSFTMAPFCEEPRPRAEFE